MTDTGFAESKGLTYFDIQEIFRSLMASSNCCLGCKEHKKFKMARKATLSLMLFEKKSQVVICQPNRNLVHRNFCENKSFIVLHVLFC